MKLTYIGKVDPKTGHIIGPELDRVTEDCKAHFSGSFVTLTITGNITKPSRSDRGYYFGVVLPAVTRAFRDLGHDLDPQDKYDKERVHQLMKDKFIQPETTVSDKGEFITWPATTKEMTKEQFRAYVDKVITWAGENMDVDFSFSNSNDE